MRRLFVVPKRIDREKVRKTFATRIGQMRTDMNLSQQQLADALGIKKDRLAKWENSGGKRLPGPEFLAPLSEIFGYSIHQLVTGRPDPTSRSQNPITPRKHPKRA